MDVLVFLIILWVIPIFVAYGQGKAKGRYGVAYGLFLGWLGVLALAVLPARDEPTGGRRRCPSCDELVSVNASVCPHCQREIPRQALTA